MLPWTNNMEGEEVDLDGMGGRGSPDGFAAALHDGYLLTPLHESPRLELSDCPVFNSDCFLIQISSLSIGSIDPLHDILNSIGTLETGKAFKRPVVKCTKHVNALYSI